VETIRTRRARVGARVAAAVVAGGAGAWIAAGAGDWAWVLAAPAALAFLLVCAGAAPVWAPALLGGEYAGALEIAGHARADGRAAAVAVALVAIAELVAWSRELEPEIPHERGLLARRLLRIVLLALGAGAVASAVLSLAAAPLELGLGGDALGIAAAVAALGLVATLARRHQH
jgi:hypothetical protein